jgi:hypothetical protein
MKALTFELIYAILRRMKDCSASRLVIDSYHRNITPQAYICDYTYTLEHFYILEGDHFITKLNFLIFVE